MQGVFLFSTFVQTTKPASTPGSFVIYFIFSCCVGIASNQRSSFIRNDVTSGAGHGKIQQTAIRGIDNKDVEYSGAYYAAMHLDYRFVIRH
jgi:hypothetical protein